MKRYPQIKSGSVISAVDLIRGIGHYAGLKIVEVEGATGLADTNYEGKADAAIEALRHDDFVFVHVEASDEAGHDGDLELKLKTIEYLDQRLIAPIYQEISTWDEPVCIAVLPDHLTPVEQRIHVGQPVPFLFWHRGITPDDVQLLAVPVLAHRIITNGLFASSGAGTQVVRDALEKTPVPTEAPLS